MLRTSLAAVALLAPALAAHDACEGNGLGNVYIQTTPATIGGTFSFDLGSPDHPGGIGVLAYANGFGPVAVPGFGTICLAVLSPTFHALPVVLDGTGNKHLDVPIPADPGLFGLPPIYAAPGTLALPNLEIGKTVPVFFEHAGSFRATGTLALGRSMHQATALGQDGKDNRIQVFVSGGGTGTIFEPQSTATTEIFQPLDRTFHAGPTMAVPRAFHSATLLADGRVLIAGGANGLGVVTKSCELYDHSTGQLLPTGPMIAPRIGHTATRLADGRVLVAGGLADYQNAKDALATALGTAQSSAEIYDPATGQWSAVPGGMASKRSGHAAVLEPDGRVLLIAGVNGGTITSPGAHMPTFTAACERYDPAAHAFVPAASIPLARGFHGATLLASGAVLVTGGLVTAGPFGEALATSTCYRFDGATWTQAGSLPLGVAFHSQVALPDGRARISGGYLGDFVTLVATANNGLHDGLTYTAGAPVGTNVGVPGQPASPRGSHTMTRLWDGSHLLLGGFHSPDTSTILVKDDGFVVTP